MYSRTPLYKAVFPVYIYALIQKLALKGSQRLATYLETAMHRISGNIPYGKKFSRIKTFVVFGDSLRSRKFIPRNLLM